MVCLLGAISLRAQTEPEKIPAKPAALHTPAAQEPPPAVTTDAKTTEGAKPKADKNPPAFDTKNMDKSVKPGDDFFSYANGGWIKRTPIPPEYARWGSFNELIEKNNDALHEIAEKAAKVAPKEFGSNLWLTC